MIARISRSGIGYVTTTDEKASQPEFVFSFNKIRRKSDRAYVSYRGESPKELGFREGAQVMFSETADGLIDSIEVAS
jgi:hypothetical protein